MTRAGLAKPCLEWCGAGAQLSRTCGLQAAALHLGERGVASGDGMSGVWEQLTNADQGSELHSAF